MSTTPAIGMRPVVSWPREVQPGRSYQITVDLATDLVEEWPYELEEYSVACLAESASWCRVESHGSNTLVVHRFGGTYGPIQFVVHIGHTDRSMPEPIRLTFLTGGGLPFHTLELRMTVVVDLRDTLTQGRVRRTARRPPAEPRTGQQRPSAATRLSPEAEELAAAIRGFCVRAYGGIRLPHTGVSRSVPVEELYVPPHLLDGSRPTTFDDLLETTTRIVVLGDPGGGKSTALSSLAWGVAKDSEQVPFLVQLREFAEAEHSLIELLQATLGVVNVAAPAAAIEEILGAGRAFLLFDGLDELLDVRTRQRVVELIETAVLDYPLTPTVVTARKVGYLEAPLDAEVFTVAELAPFTEAQVGDYVRNWYRLDDSLTRDERAGLADGFLTEAAVVADLTRNPLMLSLLCAMYAAEQFIPRNRAQLIERCSALMFERWDAQRGIGAHRPFFASLRGAVQALAGQIFEVANGTLTRSQARLTLTEHFLERVARDESDASRLADEFLDFCTGRAWVLTDVGSTTTEPLFGFTHRTFLEYFAAEHLVRQNNDPAALYQAMAPHLGDGRWHTVSELAAQLIDRNVADGADRLVRAALSGERNVDAIAYCARLLGVVSPTPRVISLVVESCVDLACLRVERRQQPGGDALSARADRPLADVLTGSLPANTSIVKSSLEAALRQGIESGNEATAFIAATLHQFLAADDPRWITLQATVADVIPKSIVSNRSVGAVAAQHRPILTRDVVRRHGVLPFFETCHVLGHPIPSPACEILRAEWPRDGAWIAGLTDALLAAKTPWASGDLTTFATRAVLDLADLWPDLPAAERRARLLLCLPFLENLARRGTGPHLGESTDLGRLAGMRSARTTAGLKEIRLPLSPGALDFLSRWLNGDIDLIKQSGTPDPARHGEPSPGPLFFLSYGPIGAATSRRTGARRAVAALFEDLCNDVQQLTGHDNPGFVDLAAQEDQGPWGSKKREALGTCQVFVALLSPDYLISDRCGKEWDAFSRRDAAPGAAVLPVIWAPVSRGQLPGVLREIQVFVPPSDDREIGESYRSKGLYGLLRDGPRNAYASAVWRLAQGVVASARTTSIKATVPEPDSLRDAFAEQ